MGRIQSNIGLSTGLDISGTVEQLISISAQPRTRLQTRIKSFETQQVAINDLTALVIGVQLQATRLGTASNLTSTAVTSSRSDVLSAKLSGTPSVGTYTLQSVQTAQSSAATSNPFSSATDVLQTGSLVVRTGGFVDGSAKLDDLRGGNGVSGGRIRIVDRGGVASTVDLRFATSMDDVIKTINAATSLRVSAKLSGDRIVLTDLTGQTTSNLVVEESGEGRTASDLGLAGINVAANSATGDDLATLADATRLPILRDGRGIAFASGSDLTLALSDGTSLSIDVDATTKPATLGQLLSTINAANPSQLEARIRSDGKGIELIDKTSGGASFSATGKLADQLGLTGVASNAGTIAGNRIANTLSGPLLSSLRGGTGIGTPGSITITNRAGNTTAIDLAGSQGLRDVIERINAAGAGVTASLNRARTGIVLQDVTGATASNLIVADSDANNTATQLKLARSVAANTLDSGSLDLQYVSETTALSQLNQGRGVRAGTIELVNSLGATRTINIGSLSDRTIGGVIAAIDATGIGLVASINAAGDGITINDSTNGSGAFTISDRSGGLAASDLGIRGTGTTKIVDGQSVRQIEGSQTFTLDVGSAPTLRDLVDRINNSNGPLTASLLVAGSTTRILFNSRSSGEAGRVFVDGSDIGIEATTTAVGRDAVIAISPTEDSGGTLVRSGSNVFDNAITGLSLTVDSVDEKPVEIRVSNDNSSIEKNLQLFVDQFNKVRDRIDTVASFNASTGATGILFGSNEVLRIEQGFARIINQNISTSGSIRSLEQLGLSLDGTGKLRFDSQKLSQALASNSTGVSDFFTKETTGFAAKARSMLENLVGVDNGTLVSRNATLQRKIEDGNRRIEFLTARLERERERLLRQFFKMEESIAKINGNSSSLATLQSLAAGTRA